MTSQRQPKTTRARLYTALQVGAGKLGMDDDAYRALLARHGACDAGKGYPSATTMTDRELGAVLDELRDKGFAPKTPYRSRSAEQAERAGVASRGQIDLIASIWKCLHEAGVVRDGSAGAMRRWCKTTSRQHSPARAGYDAPELMPPNVASRVIEALKAWAARTGVEWREEI